MIKFTVLNETSIAFIFCNENILYCHFQNLRCSTKSDLKLNGPPFYNDLSDVVVPSSDFGAC